MALLDNELRKETYAAAKTFRERTLRHLESLFTPHHPIIYMEEIHDVHRRFVENPDVSGDSFLVKLSRQFDGAPDQVIQLMAEIFYVHLLPPIDIKPGTKRKNINTVLSLMEHPVTIPPDLDAGLNGGYLRAGMGFRSGRPNQLRYLIEFYRAWIALSYADRDGLLSDPWAFKEFAFGLGVQLGASQRNALLYLVFPETFEDIVSDNHKGRIVAGFAEYAGDNSDVDRQLFSIRTALEQEQGRQIEFYGSELRPIWDAGKKEPKTPAQVGQPSTVEPEGRAWIVRPGRRQDSKIEKWLSGGYCAIGWRDAGERPSAIKARLKQAFPDESDGWIRSSVGNINRFMNAMDIGDLVVAPDGSDIYVGIVESEPYWAETGQPNRRRVEWRNADAPIERTALSAAAYSKLRTLLTVTDISDLYPEFAGYAGMEVAQAAAGTLLEPLELDSADELFLPIDWLNTIVDLLAEKRQIVFYGPPGTGKTFVAQALADKLGDAEGTTLVQFHPSYTYEDFFEGYRPSTNADGQVSFELAQGPMRRLAEAASQDPSRPFFLIIDEINRANLAKVFGELYFLLEYREQTVDLLYGSDDPFTLPKNLFVIGTMNTADRSIAFVDAAMRRRFYFVPFFPTQPPVSDVLRRWLDDNNLGTETADLLDALNARIDDPNFAIGPSYFMSKRVSDNLYLGRVWEHSILPLLEEHYFGTGRIVADEFSLETVWTSAGLGSIGEVVNAIDVSDLS